MRSIVGCLLASVSIQAALGQEFGDLKRDWFLPVETPAETRTAKSPAAKSSPGDVPARGESRVGECGDPNCVRICGVQRFTAAAIKKAIFADPWVLLLAHPSRFRDMYLGAIQARLLTGYNHLGFRDAKVDVRGSDTTVTISVHEGPRWLCGGVRVTGAKKIPVDRLMDRLTGPRLRADAAIDPDDKDQNGLPLTQRLPFKLDPPAWEKGKPAPFDEPSRQNIHDQVKEDLAALGYHFPKFTVKVVAQPKPLTAELAVQIADEGPPDVIEEIEVSGHHRDKLREILDYLKAAPGMRFDQAQRARIERLLWLSGRYAAYKVTPVERGPGEGLKLKLELTEYPRAPRISEELSRAERTLLKARQWFTEMDRQRADLVLSMGSEAVPLEIVLSPQHGSLALVREAGKPGGRIATALALTDRQLGFYDLAQKRKMAVRWTSYRAHWEIRFKLNEAELDRQPFWFGFNYSWQPREKDEAGPAMTLMIRASPALFVAMAHEYDAECTWNAQHLLVARSGAKMEIDERTGRVIQWSLLNEKQKPAGSVAFVDGAFDARMRQIQQASAPWANRFDPGRPLGSSLKTLWDDDALWKLLSYVFRQQKDYNPEVEKQVRQIGRLLLDRDALKPLDEWIVAAGRQPPVKEEDQFSLPDAFDPWGIFDFQKLWQNLPWLGLATADRLFARNSWPWTLWREMSLGWAGHTEWRSHELEKVALLRYKGPLGCLFTARLQRLYHLPGYQALAAEGLTNLAAADFRRDYRVLLPPDRVPAAVLRHAAEMLRGLNEKEVQLLARGLLKSRAGLLENFARELRARRGQPIDVALDAMLDHYWETTLRREAEGLLRELAEEKP